MVNIPQILSSKLSEDNIDEVLRCINLQNLTSLDRPIDSDENETDDFVDKMTEQEMEAQFLLIDEAIRNGKTVCPKDMDIYNKIIEILQLDCGRSL